MVAGLGKYNKLTANRMSDFGLYLQLGEEEVLLPNKYCDGYKVGDEIPVFIYKDSEDRPVATIESPMAILGEYASMEVVSSAPFGVFVDWGLEKHLLVPNSEMMADMEVGKKYLIRVMMDFKTERLIGVAKIESFSQVPEELGVDDEVQGEVYQKTDLGFKIWVNQGFIGLLYHNEVFSPLAVGDTVSCFIDAIREDGKIDLRLRVGGLESISSDAEKILAYIKSKGGEIPLTDKSSPDAIQQVFGLSKKAFKRAVGSLYKQGLITLLPDRIKSVGA